MTIGGWQDVRMGGYVAGWMNGHIDMWPAGWMKEWVDGRLDDASLN